MKKILISILISIFFVGCGSSGSGGSNGSEIIGSEESGEMTVNKIYVMYSGDIVKRLSNDAVIEVVHQNHSDLSNIKLLAGKATITRTK